MSGSTHLQLDQARTAVPETAVTPETPIPDSPDQKIISAAAAVRIAELTRDTTIERANLDYTAQLETIIQDLRTGLLGKPIRIGERSGRLINLTLTRNIGATKISVQLEGHHPQILLTLQELNRPEVLS